MTRGLLPLQQRQEQEEARRAARLQKTAEEVEAHRRQHETFAPALAPYSAGSHHESDARGEVRSEHGSGDAASTTAHVNALWAAFTDGDGGDGMTVPCVRRMLACLGVGDAGSPMVDKFMRALGVPQRAADAEHFAVPHDVFVRVFSTVLRASARPVPASPTVSPRTTGSVGRATAPPTRAGSAPIPPTRTTPAPTRGPGVTMRRPAASSEPRGVTRLVAPLHSQYHSTEEEVTREAYSPSPRGPRSVPEDDAANSDDDTAGNESVAVAVGGATPLRFHEAGGTKGVNDEALSSPSLCPRGGETESGRGKWGCSPLGTEEGYGLSVSPDPVPPYSTPPEASRHYDDGEATSPSRGGRGQPALSPPLTATRAAHSLSVSRSPLPTKVRPSLLASTASFAGKRAQKKVYDPMSECTFAPRINTYRPLPPPPPPPLTLSPSCNDASAARSSRLRSATAASSRSPSPLSEYTFQPNTARFHRRRERLAWWTAAPQTTTATTSVYAADGSRRAATPSPVAGTPQGGEEAPLPAAPAPLAPGFDKAVRRMIAARQRAKSAGPHGFGETLRRCGGRDSASVPATATVPQPFDFRLSQRREQRRPRPVLVYVDVDLPSGSTRRITVHHGDLPSTLARQFCAIHGLNDALCRQLESLLVEKLAEHATT